MKYGYEESCGWLERNAPEWRLEHADSRLTAGAFVGDPTQLKVEVVLVNTSLPYRVELLGEGRDMLEAVQAAIGALRIHDHAGTPTACVISTNCRSCAGKAATFAAYSSAKLSGSKRP